MIHLPSLRFSVKNFIRHHNQQQQGNEGSDSIEAHYDLTNAKILGEGAFGEVLSATNNRSKEERAIKRLIKIKSNNMGGSTEAADRQREEILQEFTVLKELDHPDLLKVYDLYEDKVQFHIVTDLYGGGDVIDYMEEVGSAPEKDAQAFMNTLLSCMKHLHQHSHIVHRDLKLENILLDSSGSLQDIKLIDFGLARHFTEAHSATDRGTIFSDLVGSTYYISPQVIDGEYTAKCDIWSCGVIAYMLLAGYAPFDGNHDGQILQAICDGVVDFKDPVWDTVSDQARDFVCNLLAYEEDERPSAAQALAHPWLQGHRCCKKKEQKTKRNSIRRSMTALKGFHSKDRKLKQATCSILASQFLRKEEKTNFINDSFATLDYTISGSITPTDLRHALKDELGETSDDVKLKSIVDGIMEQVNWSGTGEISFSEFAIALMFETNVIQDKFRLVFDFLDIDKDGCLSAQDLHIALHLGETNSELDEHHMMVWEDFRDYLTCTPKDETAMSRSSVVVAKQQQQQQQQGRRSSTSSTSSAEKTKEDKEEVPSDSSGEEKCDANDNNNLKEWESHLGMPIQTKEECYSWYARLGMPTQEEMIEKIKRERKRRGSSCKITIEDVNRLPWIGGGARLQARDLAEVKRQLPADDPNQAYDENWSFSEWFSALDQEEKEVVVPDKKPAMVVKLPPPRPTREVHTTPRKAKTGKIGVSTILTSKSNDCLTTETNLDTVDPVTGKQQTIVRTRKVQPRFTEGICTTRKKKLEFDWVSLGNTKLKIASYEERQQMIPSFDWKCIAKATPNKVSPNFDWKTAIDIGCFSKLKSALSAQRKAQEEARLRAERLAREKAAARSSMIEASRASQSKAKEQEEARIRAEKAAREKAAAEEEAAEVSRRKARRKSQTQEEMRLQAERIEREREAHRLKKEEAEMAQHKAEAMLRAEQKAAREKAAAEEEAQRMQKEFEWEREMGVWRKNYAH